MVVTIARDSARRPSISTSRHDQIEGECDKDDDAELQVAINFNFGGLVTVLTLQRGFTSSTQFNTLKFTFESTLVFENKTTMAPFILSYLFNHALPRNTRVVINSNK